MKLFTRDTDYAVRALSCIAGSESGVVTTSELAESLKIPKPFLRKILQILNRKKLLKSYRGKGGGFSLVVKPEKINVFDLIEIFQGPFELNEHKFKGKICPFFRICVLKKSIDGIEDHVIRELKSITIASLLKGCKKKKKQIFAVQRGHSIW